MDVRLPGPLNPLMLRPSEHGDRKSHRGGVIPDPRSDQREEYERSRRGFSGTSVNFTSPAPARAGPLRRTKESLLESAPIPSCGQTQSISAQRISKSSFRYYIRMRNPRCPGQRNK
jgi:hypothetical protein